MDNTRITQAAGEVIETGSTTMGLVRLTQASSEVIEQAMRAMNYTRFTQVTTEVIETQPARYHLRTSQLAVEVILTRYETARKFIGWGVPL